MRSASVGHLTLFAVTILFAVGCDPGWNYHVPDPRPGAPDSMGGREIGLRVEGSLFTSELGVQIELTNRGSFPLIVREDPFRVLDASHRPLPWYRGRPPTEPCENLKQKIVVLDPGKVCILRGNFEVRPNAGFFGGRNTDLRNLTVVVDGLKKAGLTASRSVILEWE
jgi:hypothetical protein